MKQNRMITLGIFVFIGLILTISLSNSIFKTIESGEKGVVFYRFGSGLDKKNIKGEGFHVIAPWNKMFVYNVRVVEDNDVMNVLSKNGLEISIKMSYRYNPIPNEIGYLHEEIGENYLESILKPDIRSATREVIGKYLPEELYSTKREAIQDEIFTQTTNAISPKHLYLDAVLIREVELPDLLRSAIETKLEEEQQALQMDFKINKERKEAERKIIEAEAKSKANLILSQSLTSNILKDKGIDATMELANSPNSKIIIVGSAGSDGLPLILGNN